MQILFQFVFYDNYKILNVTLTPLTAKMTTHSYDNAE